MTRIKTLSCIVLTWLLIASAFSQDTRERHYMYEILKPSHATKPEVNGFASKRVVEPLGRGLTLAHMKQNGALHISWRLLQTAFEPVSATVYCTLRNKGQ